MLDIIGVSIFIEMFLIAVKSSHKSSDLDQFCGNFWLNSSGNTGLES